MPSASAKTCEILDFVCFFGTVAHFGRIDNENFKIFGTVEHFGNCRQGYGNKFGIVLGLVYLLLENCCFT